MCLVMSTAWLPGICGPLTLPYRSPWMRRLVGAARPASDPATLQSRARSVSHGLSRFSRLTIVDHRAQTSISDLVGSPLLVSIRVRNGNSMCCVISVRRSQYLAPTSCVWARLHQRARAWEWGDALPTFDIR